MLFKSEFKQEYIFAKVLSLLFKHIHYSLMDKSRKI